MVLLQFEVIHFSVTLVTHSVCLLVIAGQLSLRLRADATDAEATTFAVLHWVLADYAGEWCLT